MNATIYHNPRCSKSRQTLALLEEQGIAIEVVDYLKTPLDVPQLRALVEQLGDGVSFSDIVRPGEARFKELGLGLDDAETLYAAIAEDPILMQRPIVVNNGRAAIGRPPESVLELFK